MRRVLVLLLALAGCAGEDAAETPAPPVEISAERGPVSVTVRAASGEVAAGERFAVTVDALAEPGVEIAMPQWEEEAGPFQVHDTTTPPDVPEGERRRWTQRVELSTFESGPLEVPEVTVGFVDRRPQAGAEPIESELVVGPLALEVRSWIGDDAEAAASPTPPRDIRGLVHVPGEGRRTLLMFATAGAALVLALVAAVLWWLWRRSRGEAVAAAPPPVPAHIWARGQLDALAAEALPEAGRLHEYFFRLSDIVRQYVERRYAIRAPERTTEEFIREMRDHPVLSSDHQDLLRQFLRSADMVKFALHEPPLEECGAAMVAGRQFVEQTAAEAAA